MNNTAKKIISITAAASMALTAPAAIAENSTADEAVKVILEQVKQRVDIPEEYSVFSINSVSNDSAMNFTWQTEDREKSINVSCTGSGIITDVSSYDFDYSFEKGMSKMSTDEARQIAESFVKKTNPDYPYKIEIENNSPSVYTANRYFKITVFINGVPLSENGSVTVNTELGRVTDFDIFGDDTFPVEFNSKDELIDAETAKKAYADKLGMELVYASYYDNKTDKNVFYPVYVRKSSAGEYINAKTGEVENQGFAYLRNTFTEDADAGDGVMMAKAAGSFTPQELEEIDNISGVISKEDIEKQLRSNKTLKIPSDMKLSSIELYKDSREDTYYYHVYMSNTGSRAKLRTESSFSSAYLTVNAKTGEIISYSCYPNNATDAKTVTRNDDTLKKLAGDKADEYQYNEDRNLYERYVNGIRVQNDSASITYRNGILTHYSINYSDAQFPSVDGAISTDEAVKAFFEQVEYKPVCVRLYRQSETDSSDVKTAIAPVYSYGNVISTSVNAFTGKLVNWRNEEVTNPADEKITYSDISGHYAEKYISALAEYGIGFDGGEFKPDEKITQSALLTLLSSITNYDTILVRFNDTDQADYAFNSAAGKGIINEDERDDNAVITRETASIYLIRAIGAEDYAKYEDIYVTPFTDVTKNKGYIALLYAMGIISGDDGGTFSPEREITRAEFAVMLYNYLNN